MKKLKIGIMGTRGIPNHYGGFEQFAQYLSLGLFQKGHDVYVYNSDRHPHKDKQWNGVQIIHCRDLEHKLGTFGQFFYDLACIYDAGKRNFDILLHLGYTSDSVWHWKWPKKTVNIMNMDGMEWKRSKYTGKVQRFLRWAESLAAKNAQVLVADSPRMQDYLLAEYGKKAVYIPYGAEVFADPDSCLLKKFQAEPHRYFLLVARMEPENNIEMIIRGHLASGHAFPLIVVGNITNKYGKYLSSTYTQPSIHFTGPVYDQPELNNLRYYSAKYFHGHSVGGTNPSLLEAMACGCDIAAHGNVFNRAILANDADYFSSSEEIAAIISNGQHSVLTPQRKQLNLEKIRIIYNLEKNISDYERLMLSVCPESKLVMRASAAGTL